MKKIIFFTLLLCGCANKTIWSSGAYSDELQKYIGQSEISLYQEWGSPDNVIAISPYNKVVSYTEYYAAPQGGQMFPYAQNLNYKAMNQGFTAENIRDYYCTTSFTIQNGVIASYSFNGDDCAAKQ